jgi:hypothetical protein
MCAVAPDSNFLHVFPMFAQCSFMHWAHGVLLVLSEPLLSVAPAAC